MVSHACHNNYAGKHKEEYIIPSQSGKKVRIDFKNNQHMKGW
jgi:hypothetical protein